MRPTSTDNGVWVAKDRFGARCGLAKAIVPNLVHGDQVGLADLRADIGAEISIHCVPHGVVIGKRESHAVDRSGRNQRGQDQTRQREELDASGANLAQCVGVRTQLAIGKDLQVEPAIGFLFDCGRHLPRPSVQRVCFRKIVGVFVDPLRLLSASDARSSQKRQARAGEQTAPGDCGF